MCRCDCRHGYDPFASSSFDRLNQILPSWRAICIKRIAHVGDTAGSLRSRRRAEGFRRPFFMAAVFDRYSPRCVYTALNQRCRVGLMTVQRFLGRLGSDLTEGPGCQRPRTVGSSSRSSSRADNGATASLSRLGCRALAMPGCAPVPTAWHVAALVPRGLARHS